MNIRARGLHLPRKTPRALALCDNIAWDRHLYRYPLFPCLVLPYLGAERRKSRPDHGINFL